MLVVPSASGMNQNQPCSNQQMLMLPSFLPSSRFALRKWPNSAELLWAGFLSLMRSLFASSVSRPEASSTKRARHSRADFAPSLPVSSACTVAPSASNATSRTRHDSSVCAPLVAAWRNSSSSSSERRTCHEYGIDLSHASANSR